MEHEHAVTTKAVTLQEQVVAAEGRKARAEHLVEWQEMVREEVAALQSLVSAIQCRREREKQLRALSADGRLTPMPDLSLPDAFVGQVLHQATHYPQLVASHVE